MFEIWGTLKKEKGDTEKRLEKYLTHVFLPSDALPLVPPAYSLWKHAIEKYESIILTFRYYRYENSPYVTLNQLKAALLEFESVKAKTVVALSATGFDYNLDKNIHVPLTANQANLKAAIRSCPIFFSDEMGAAYFTYGAENAHLVWFENTKSLALKHNLIKNSGFKGIYWENPYALPEGNWEALYEIWQKRDSK